MIKEIDLYPENLEEEAWGVNIERRLNKIKGRIISVIPNGDCCYKVIYETDETKKSKTYGDPGHPGGI